MHIPQQPISPSLRICSRGKISSRSICRTTGRTSVSMNWRMVSRSSFCSSLKEKSISGSKLEKLAQPFRLRAADGHFAGAFVVELQHEAGLEPRHHFLDVPDVH